MQFEILCVTMGQSDFSKIKEMNIHSNVVFANQGERTAYDEFHFEDYTAKMISTNTRGVGINRNLALMYASADICLLADDDIRYTDTCAKDIVAEFQRHPKADVIIFNIVSNDEKRQQKQNLKFKKTNRLSHMPYGAPRIAFRRTAWQKSNIWFTTLFGGGAKYTNGEDSLFLNDLRKSGLNVYLSNICIGIIDMSNSTWYKGRNEEYFFNKGAYCVVAHPKTCVLWQCYYAIRLKSQLTIKERLKWMRLGSKNYKKLISYNELVS